MKRKLPDLFLLIIGCFLFVAFVLSSVKSFQNDLDKQIGYREFRKQLDTYFTNSNMIRRGYNLDCSGFTAEVFGQFGADLPASALEQYLTFKDHLNEPLPGNLVFFVIDHSMVNHVGIMLNDSLFMHSPGANK